MKNILLVMLFLFISCKPCENKKNDLVLKILNKEINTYDKKPIQYRTFKNTINISIKNNSKHIYYLVYSNYWFFNNSNLSLGSVIIKDSIGNKITTIFGGHGHSISNCYDERNKQYKDLGYANMSLLMYRYEKSSIVIHPNETLFFENLLSLPDNTASSLEFSELKKGNKYKLSLFFKIDTTFYKGRLTKSTIKTIKENNYQLFHGTITSENSVPIVFID